MVCQVTLQGSPYVVGQERNQNMRVAPENDQSGSLHPGFKLGYHWSCTYIGELRRLDVGQEWQQPR